MKRTLSANGPADDYQPKLNGSMPRAAVQRRYDTAISTRLHEGERTAEKPFMKWRKNKPMLTGFTTCSAMCGSGRAIGMARNITSKVRQSTRPARPSATLCSTRAKVWTYQLALCAVERGLVIQP